MFRQSPYYLEVRQEVFNPEAGDLIRQMEEMSLSRENPGPKKSVSKQEFKSYFNRCTQKAEQVEIEYCKFCTKQLSNQTTKCDDCNGRLCESCVIYCHKCNTIVCLICSSKIYTHYGDFNTCLNCSEF